MIITMIGKMCTGKTTLSKYIKNSIFDSKCDIFTFASLIKDIQKSGHFILPYNIYNIDYTYVINVLISMEKKINEMELYRKINNPSEKPREQYQLIGDTYKKLFGENFFASTVVDSIIESTNISSSICNCSNSIIEDCRFLVEFNEIIDRIPETLFIYLFVDDDIRNEIARRMNIGIHLSNHRSETEVDSIFNIISNRYHESIEVSDGRILHFYTSDRKLLSTYSSIIENIAICSSEFTTVL